MADYVAREWSGGDIITAANLNHLEQGIAESGMPLVVNVVDSDPSATELYGSLKSAVQVVSDNYWLDKTWQDIYDAFPNVYVYDSSGKRSITQVILSNNDYEVYISGYSASLFTDTPTDYPSRTIEK